MTASCTDGDVHLVGGGTQYEGRVELCLNGGWGRVCFNRNSYDNAYVVCRQLGFPPSSEDMKCEVRQLVGNSNTAVVAGLG